MQVQTGSLDGSPGEACRAGSMGGSGGGGGGGSPWPTIGLVTVGLLLPLPGLWRCSLPDLSHLVGRSRGPAK